jgi:uncharacterized protein (DUF362 family)
VIQLEGGFAVGLFVAQTEDRKGFVRKLFGVLGVAQRLRNVDRVLIKPNIVSSEPYPSTTHPDVLSECLRLITQEHRAVAVADGPAVDAGDSRTILDGHPLKRICDSFGVPLLDLARAEPTTVSTGTGMELEIAALALQYDFVVSLPVLKAHGVCFLTGALKNQFGFFSTAERVKLHLGEDIFRAIAEVNRLVRPGLFVVDAVETMIGANELRHGGAPAKLGYMLGGVDPVSLDAFGLGLIGQVDPGLSGKGYRDIPYLAQAAELAIGDPGARPVFLDL